MTPAAAELVRRAADWLVEPPAPEPPLHVVTPGVAAENPSRLESVPRLTAAPVPRYPVVAVVGLSPRCGATTIARALDLELGARAGRRAVGPSMPQVLEPAQLTGLPRHLAPVVVEVARGSVSVESAPLVDRVVLVASPDLDPILAAAVGETIEGVAARPVIAVSRARDHGPWLTHADVLVPTSRVGARLVLAGRDPRGWLGRSISQLADLCAPA